MPRKTSIKLADDVTFEQNFFQLAFAYIRDKIPNLMDYMLGFEVVNKNDDGTFSGPPGNNEHRPTGYFYVVRVEDQAVGEQISVQLYDPAYKGVGAPRKIANVAHFATESIGTAVFAGKTCVGEGRGRARARPQPFHRALPGARRRGRPPGRRR
jgi:hypothetical protein